MLSCACLNRLDRSEDSPPRKVPSRPALNPKPGTGQVPHAVQNTSQRVRHSPTHELNARVCASHAPFSAIHKGDTLQRNLASAVERSVPSAIAKPSFKNLQRCCHKGNHLRLFYLLCSHLLHVVLFRACIREFFWLPFLHHRRCAFKIHGKIRHNTNSRNQGVEPDG